MNSYLRAALNARAVRTAYNVLNQYRLLVESMIRGGADDIAIEGVRHMIYYGRTSYDMQLGFVTETVAYDVVGAVRVRAPAQQGRRRSTTRCSRCSSSSISRCARKRQEAGPAGHPQGAGQARLLLPRRSAPRTAREKIADDMAGEDRERLAVDPRAARARRVEGVLGDHRSRPQLRVHAAAPEGADGHVLRAAAGRALTARPDRAP